MVYGTAWLKQCCLQLNVSKTVCMFFTKTNSSSVEPDACIRGEAIGRMWMQVPRSSDWFQTFFQGSGEKGL